MAGKNLQVVKKMEKSTTVWLCLRNSSDKVQTSPFGKLDINSPGILFL
jgi:16S rRNA U516 pseudouridylate synthase RsuA-like enzyme